MSVAYAINRVEHCLPHRRHVRRNALMFEEEMTRELMWKKRERLESERPTFSLMIKKTR